MLEVQQQLAVAVSAEQKKDVMIEQLDKVAFKLCDLNYAKFGIFVNPDLHFILLIIIYLLSFIFPVGILGLFGSH